MAGFLYYLPGQTSGVTREQVRDAGLGYAFDDEQFTISGVMANGPDEGHVGIVAADPKRVEKIGIYDKQLWSAIYGTDAWAGLYVGREAPGPGDLERAEQIAGHWITLADGNKWQCPVARGVVEEGDGLAYYYGVPRISHRDDQGRFVPGNVVKKYAFLWHLATRWHDVRIPALFGEPSGSDDSKVSFDFDGLHIGAIEALAINYVIGPTECSVLGLLTQDIAVDILDALIDLPTRCDWLKKKCEALDTLNSDVGNSADTPATDQP